MLKATDVFVSDIADVAVHPSGLYRLKSGARITKLALWDKDKNLFARLTPQCGPLLKQVHPRMRLSTKAEIDELRAAGVDVAPYAMPKQDRLIAAGIVRSAFAADDGGTAAYVAALNRFRDSHMRELGWCAEHDAAVFRELAAAGWTPESDKPVYGDGKYWMEGEAIYGWYDIQPRPSFFHRGTPHTDYATTVHGVIDGDDADTVPAPASYPGGADLLAAAQAAFEPVVEAVVDLAEEAYEDFLSWFQIDGHPVAREGAEPTEAHDGPEELPDLVTPATPAEVLALLPGSRDAKLILAAQWHLETAGGRAMHNYNVGNIKGRPGDPARCWQFFPCGEELQVAQARAEAAKGTGVTILHEYQRAGLAMASVHVVPKHPWCCFRASRALRGGIDDYLGLLQIPRYLPAFQRAMAGDVVGFGTLLGRGGYMTAPVDQYTAELGRRRDIVARAAPG